MVKKILNPMTNRLVSVGSPTWRKLIRDGILSNQVIDEEVEVLGDIPDDPYLDALKREELRDRLEPGYVPKKGRHGYTGKYVKSRSPNHPANILKNAKSRVKEFARERYQEASDDEELNDEIDQLFNDMALSQVKQRVAKNQKSKKPQYVKREMPELTTQDEDSYDSLTSESESDEDEPVAKRQNRKPIRSVPQYEDDDDSITSTESEDGE